MRTFLKNIGYIAASLVLLLSACQPQEDVKIDLGEKPVISASDYSVEVLANSVKFKFTADKATPIWFINETALMTSREFTLSYLWKGNYSIKLKEYNKAGISDSIIIPFVIETTDPSICANTTYKNLTGGCEKSEGKTWIWDSKVKGHLGCGDPLKNVPDWWSANANEKANLGIYDDELTFVLNVAQDFTLKTNGDVLVNADAAISFDPAHYTTKPSSDVTILFTPPKQNWSIVEVSGVQYIVLSNGGFPSYVSNPSALATGAKYKILSLTANELYIVLNATGINWYYRFIPK